LNKNTAKLAKKLENMVHVQEKTQLTETYPEISELMEFSKMLTAIVNVPHALKEAEKNTKYGEKWKS
jgi:hypothetical protein